MPEQNSVEGFTIREIGINRSEGKVTLVDVSDKPGMVARIFREAAEKEINVNLIVQNSRPDGSAYVTFTVPRSQLDVARSACEQILDELSASAVQTDASIASVIVVGVGMRSHTGVAARMFGALGKANINIDLISTSEIKIECVVRQEQVESARAALLEEFHAEMD